MPERTIIDARGSFCPGPLMELIARLKFATVGEEFEVLSTDKGSASEIPEWVRKVGHELLGTREEAGVWHIALRKTK
ncbi:MAG TPA: sulfurtransferase TusA family protein [Burkholderiales bacterium]|nr:sulfurtransferase TusA family protein [Burkholderiales bacterium]